MIEHRDQDERAKKGLSEAEAMARLAADGPNELPSKHQRTGFRIFLDIMREPMLVLLVAGGAIYAVFGETRDGGGWPARAGHRAGRGDG
jgi:P-type Ca2+ transporter type 2C